MAKKKLLIVVGKNSLENAPYEVGTNHEQFWYRLGRSHPNISFIYVNPSRMSIDRMRNLVGETAQQHGADYFLFLDDDILIQPTGLQQLLDCKADIATGKVVIRGYPFDWMVFKKKNGGGLYPCKQLPDKGIVPCDAVGFSFCLIKTSILKDIPKPWFVTGANNTEDIYFCIKARQANPKCKIVVDCSIRCGHILWPEVMDATNREAYRSYFLKMNPHLKEQFANRGKSPDRGQEYLQEVKGQEVTPDA